MSTPDLQDHQDTQPRTTAAGPPINSEVHGRDIDGAIHLYSDGYNGTGMHATKSDDPFAFRYTIRGDEQLTLRTSRFAASILGTVDPEGEYVVSWISAGEGVMDVGGEEKRLTIGQPAMFPTGKRFAFRFRDYAQNLIHFDSAFLERVAAERAGAAPTKLHFLHTEVPGREALIRWQEAVASVAGTILGSEATPLMRSEANLLAANALLDTFAYEGPEATSLTIPPSSGRLAAALEFVHSHAEMPLTTTDIAQAAGLSLRGLQHAFSRQFEMTPTEYLRGVRLDRVRVDLLAATPSRETVASIAHRWGFSHSGRFSSAYAKRFGEYPTETLRR
ncbi:helix-turn-helix domain-containing protein [Frondihabitans peucedani]